MEWLLDPTVPDYKRMDAKRVTLSEAEKSLQEYILMITELELAGGWIGDDLRATALARTAVFLGSPNSHGAQSRARSAVSSFLHHIHPTLDIESVTFLLPEIDKFAGGVTTMAIHDEIQIQFNEEFMAWNAKRLSTISWMRKKLQLVLARQTSSNT